MKLSKIGKSLESFPVAYFLLAALSFCGFTALTTGITIASVVILAIGTLRFISTFPVLWRGRRLPLVWVGLGIIFSYGISMLLNASYGVVGNLKGICWLFLTIGVLLPFASIERAEGRNNKLPLFVWVFIIYTGIAAAASLYMLAINYGAVPKAYILIIGVVENRLYGFYTDPNYGGILSAAAAVMSLMLMFAGIVKKCYIKLILWFHIILQWLYIIFGYSRTAQLLLMGGFILAFAYYVLVKRPKIYKGAAVALAMLLIFTQFDTVRDKYNYYVYLVNEGLYNQEEEVVTTEAPTTPDEEQTEIAPTEAPTETPTEAPTEAPTRANEPLEAIVRTSEISSDLSGIRVPIWKDGLDIFKANPLFGVTYRNIRNWLETNRPDSYVVNFSPALNTFHNVFVDVLASQGAVGFGLFLAAIVLVIIASVRIFKKHGIKKLDRALIFALPALMIMGGAMLISDIMYINSPTTVTFWYCLGQWLSYDPKIESLCLKEKNEI